MSTGRIDDHQLYRSMGDPRHVILETFGRSKSWKDQKLYQMITGTPPLPQRGIRDARRVHHHALKKERIRLERLKGAAAQNDKDHRAKRAAITKDRMDAHRRSISLTKRLRRTEHVENATDTMFERLLRQSQTDDSAAWQRRAIRSSKL